MEYDKRWSFLLLGPVLLLGAVQLLWVTSLGPGVHEDSYSYMDTAWGFLHGYGFQRDGEPATHFPPGYSILLAAAYLAADNLVDAARWLHVFFYELNLALIGILGYFVSGGSVLALVLSPLAIILSGELLLIYSTAGSESPFIALMLGGFLLLAAHIAAPQWRRLFGAAVLLGLAMAMRYVGITLLAPAVASLLLLDKRRFTYRIRDCFLFSLASLLPLGVWIVRNVLLTGAATDRHLVFHPVGLDHVKELVGRLCYLYFPVKLSLWLIVPLLAAILATLVWQLHRQQVEMRAKALLFLMAGFSAVYVGFVFVSMSFFDASTELEYRILAPVAVALIALTIALCMRLVTTTDRRWLRWLLAGFVLCSLAANAPLQWRTASNLHASGYYYSSRQWRESETLAFIRSAPSTVTLYSNHPHGISYWLGRRTRMIPRKILPMSMLPAQDFAQATAAMCHDASANGALIAFLNGERWYLPTVEEVKTACGLSISQRFDDGLVLAHRSPRALPIDPLAH